MADPSSLGTGILVGGGLAMNGQIGLFADKVASSRLDPAWPASLEVETVQRRLLVASLPLLAAVFALTGCQPDGPSATSSGVTGNAVGTDTVVSPSPSAAAPRPAHVAAAGTQTIRHVSGQPLPNAQ